MAHQHRASCHGPIGELQCDGDPDVTHEDFLKTLTLEELLGEVLVRVRRIPKKNVGARAYIQGSTKALLDQLSPEILALKGED